MTTISILTCLYGQQYVQYLNRWWESVRRLHRQPDEIVLATVPGNTFGLFESVPDWCKAKIVKLESNATGVHGPWYDGMRATTSEWIFGLGVDDQFSPDAFDEVQQAADNDGQLIIDRMEYLQGGDWPANWIPDNWRDRRFAPGGVCGFHRSLLPLWDEFPADLRWNDHAFYLMALKRNVRLYRASTTRMIHDLGYHHQTISGVSRDTSYDTQGHEQLAKFIESLGL